MNPETDTLTLLSRVRRIIELKWAMASTAMCGNSSGIIRFNPQKSKCPFSGKLSGYRSESFSDSSPKFRRCVHHSFLLPALPSSQLSSQRSVGCSSSMGRKPAMSMEMSPSNSTSQSFFRSSKRTAAKGRIGVDLC